MKMIHAVLITILALEPVLLESADFPSTPNDGIKTSNATVLIETMPRLESPLPSEYQAHPLDSQAQSQLSDMLADQYFKLARTKNALGNRGKIVTTPYMNKRKKSESPKEGLAFISHQLSELKKRTFNNRLEAFDLKSELYHKGKMSLESYFQVMATTLHPNAVKKGQFPQVETYKKLIKMEKSINFSEVDRQRSLVLRRLVYRLDASAQKKLRKMVMSYRLGEINHTEFYSYLEWTSKKSGINWDTYGALKNFSQLAMQSQKLIQPRLMSEIQHMEDQCYRQLVETPLERSLVRQSQETDRLIASIDISTFSPSMAWAKNEAPQ